MHRILDSTQLYHGPRGSRVLASMGAEAIKVEPRTTCEPGRALSHAAPSGFNHYYSTLNQGKKSFTVEAGKVKAERSSMSWPNKRTWW